MVEEIKCPYCKSDNIDFTDLVDKFIESYYCEDCGEYFYVELVYDIVDIKVRKTKY